MSDTVEPLVQGEISFSDRSLARFLSFSGLSGPEPPLGRWTDGPSCTLAFRLPRHVQEHVLLHIDAIPFVHGKSVPEQIVDIVVNGAPPVEWHIFDTLARRRVVLVKRDLIPESNEINIGLTIPTCAQPWALGLNNDKRNLGLRLCRFAWQALSEVPPDDSLIWQYGRPVGGEARKTFDRKIESGFWSRFITGRRILDIGFRGYLGDRVVPIMPGAIGVDLDYPGYDGRTLPF
ncbi:MAG TPA: hypothetical protein VKI44_24355, partial [Acetobacteraceae bacterium]|nr:hypothetical protein [Acetobacteraceae bacterium]